MKKTECAYDRATGEDMKSIWRVRSNAEAELMGEINYGLLILDGLVGGSFEQLERMPEDMDTLDSLAQLDVVTDALAMTAVA